MHERKDGYDTVQWIAQQPWSNGRVGMVGASYMAYTQWAALAENPPALKAIVSDSTPPDPYQNIPYENGCFLLATSLWYAGLIDPSGAGGTGRADAYKVLPLSKVDVSVSGKANPTFQKWLRKERPEDWNLAETMSDVARSKIPTLFLSGWQDGDHVGTYLRWKSRPSFSDQYLIVGPWGHGAPQGDGTGLVPLKNHQSTTVKQFRDQFLARYLDDDHHAKALPFKTAIKIEGTEKWLYPDTWPAPQVQMEEFHLDLDDRGQGVLSRVTSKIRKEAKYTYDPRHINIISALRAHPLDDMSPEPLQLSDLPTGRLLFRSDPITKDMTIGGPSTVSMRFATSAVDTDFFLQLFDETDGHYKPIGQAGKFRCRYTVTPNGKLLVPGKEYSMTVQTWDASYRLQRGHRLALMISSDRFPVYALNLNTGEPLATGTRAVPATQTVYLGMGLSRLIVPLLDTDKIEKDQ